MSTLFRSHQVNWCFSMSIFTYIQYIPTRVQYNCRISKSKFLNHVHNFQAGCKKMRAIRMDKKCVLSWESQLTCCGR